MANKHLELLHPTILYQRNLEFDVLDDEELDELLYGVETALSLVNERLRTGSFIFLDYELVFRGTSRIFGTHLDGEIDLSQDRTQRVDEFFSEYRNCLEKVRTDYRENPEKLRFVAHAIVYRDSITASEQ
ncbi:MAG: hypothetical protein RL557_690 [archaeon]|jgi:hypothetical protein